MALKIDTNLLRLQANFLRLVEDLDDVSEVFKKFIPYFQDTREGWIMAGRVVEGQRYAKLSPRYAIAKRAKWGQKPILVASGKLLGAVKGGPGWVEKIGPKSLSMGVDIDYASYHQDGAPDSNLPQRNYFLDKKGNLIKKDYAQLIQLLEGHIDENLDTIFNPHLGGLL